MRLSIKQLNFSLPDNPFGDNAAKLSEFSSQLRKYANKAGTGNNKFRKAFEEVYLHARNNGDISSAVRSKVHVRAISFALKSDVSSKITISKKLLDVIERTVKRPSSLFVESLFEYFLTNFTKLQDIQYVSQWLIKYRRDRKLGHKFDTNLISENGPKWLADQAILEKMDFDRYIETIQLDRYFAGEFMTLAKKIYYVEQLKKIPVNQPHEILSEVQRSSVYESRYDESNLLGHVTLRTLIERAPNNDISDSWLNTILSIGGDPRIPTNHPKYIKWWSHIQPNLIAKVRGWLSKLDLRLFLEALQDYSLSSGKADLKRMYPSRKRFLEGLFDAGFITHTRLYLSSDASRYLRKHYKAEHLPSFSNVDGDRSIVHVQLGDRHIIEGSHSCYLWLYRSLPDSALVFNYDKDSVSYFGLTSGMGAMMMKAGHPPVDNIQHNPSGFYWQKKAVKHLKQMNVPVRMKDVLTPQDYSTFVRKYGADV